MPRLTTSILIILSLLLPLTFGLVALGLPRWLSLILLAGFFVIPFLLDAWLFNRPKSQEQQLAELEATGLIERKFFQATRAFGIQAMERIGRQYYLELSDGKVLYLAGELLESYEPNHLLKRCFPCTEFELWYHKTEHTVLELKVSGRALEPELLLKPILLICEYPLPHLKNGVILQISYEKIKEQQLQRVELYKKDQTIPIRKL